MWKTNYIRNAGLSWVILCFSLITYAQHDIVINVKADKENYEKAMALEQVSPHQLDSITFLSINYSYTNKDSCLALGIKSIELGEKIDETPAFANALLELGDTYRIYGDYEKSLELLTRGLEKYKILNDTRQIAYAENKLGAYYSGKGDNEKAITHYLEALKSYEMLKDTQNIFKPNLNIAWIFYRLNQYDRAQEYNNKAYELASAIDDTRQLGMALNNRGIYLKAILEKLIEQKDTLSEGNEFLQDSINTIREVIYLTHQQSLDIAKALNDKIATMRSLVNLAIMKDDDGDYAKAISLSMEADKISKQVGNLDLDLSNKNILCKSLRNNGQLKSSIEIGEASLSIAKSNNMAAYIAGANNELLQSYKAAGYYKKALSCLEEINEYIRTSNEANTTKTIADAEAKYQNIKSKNELLEQRNEILELEGKTARIQKQRNLILGGSSFVLLLGFFGQRFIRIKRESNDKKEFAEALMYAQEEERKRIARDLHDGIGQSLLMIQKQLEQNRDVGMENKNLISHTLEEVRTISRELHPFQLEKFGLKVSLENMLERISTMSEIFVTKDIELGELKLSDKVELNIYRVIQEAINNIVKHSGASAAKLIMHLEKNNLNVKILDNGKGFDQELTYVKSKSLGLRTMKERVENIEGLFKIYSNEPQGTVVEFSIPIKP